ncbi:MAG TPA: biotin/lipoyl-binding protein, partial [Parvularculaceae bacterium]|nr:biotin/lipoyl-binding protein [Parvularculaceae bacterium]
MKRVALVLCILLLAACSGRKDDVLTGYVEGETLTIGPQDAGRIASLSVKEGDHVGAGDLLFSMDPARA